MRGALLLPVSVARLLLEAAGHANPTAAHAGRLNSHVNIIPYNPVDDADFVRPSRNAVFAFANAVREGGCDIRAVPNTPASVLCTRTAKGSATPVRAARRRCGASIRVTRGLEAAAACGQLRNAFVKLPLTDASAVIS